MQTYDITHYQPLPFCAGNVPDDAKDVVGGFFASVDDDLVSRVLREASTAAR